MTVLVEENIENDILSFDFEDLNPDVAGVVDAGAHTVTLTVPNGTVVIALIPTITVSSDATISPSSGIAQNFTSSVEYTVTAQDGTDQIWTVTVIVEKNAENDILTFVFEELEPNVNGIIDTEVHTVNVNVPNGTVVNTLIPTITVSSDATISPSSGVTQDFSIPVEYTVTAQDGTDQIWTVNVIVGENTENDILTFDFEDLDPVVIGVVDVETYSVTLTVPYGTNATELVPIIAVSFKATISPLSGVARDFSIPVEYTVTAQDGTDQLWIVTVIVEENTKNDILTFDFEGLDPDVIGVVDAGAHTVTLTVPYGTVVSSLVPTITISPDATIDPLTALAQNFTSPIEYTVTAQNGTDQLWTVTVIIEENTENDILKFDFEDLDPDVIGIVDAGAHKVSLTVPYGTILTTLVPTITVSADATINPLTDVAQDFSSPVTYTVTAQNGIIKEWEVTVIIPTPTEISIYEIQNNSEGTSDSPYLNELVKTYGVVTGTGNGGFFMQDTAAAWNGIYINTNISATQGDSITIVGYVNELQNGTLLNDALEYTVLNSGVTLPTALVLSIDEAIDEKYESVLVTINNLSCTEGPNSLNEFTFEDENNNEIIVDDILYNHTFIVENIYSITGIRQTYYGNKLCPRYANDVNNAPEISNITLDPTIPTSTNDVIIKATVTDDNVDASNLTVGLFYGDTEGSENSEVPFIQIGTTNEFEGTVPASSSNIFYKITASDGAGLKSATGNYSITTGINNPKDIVSLNIFPNPNNGLFTLELNANKAETFNIEIINIQGQLVFNKEFTQDGFYKCQIDLSNEARGIYYIRINDGINIKISKIIIQ